MAVKVLHVFDRSSGGVPEAILDFVSNSPSHVEHIICGPADASVRKRLPPEVKYLQFSKGNFSQFLEVRSAVSHYSPDLVHAHSSISGLLVRIAFSRFNVRIAYSPHCFAFERVDLPRVLRFMLKLIESGLSRNTTVIAACSRREEKLAREISSGPTKVVYVPNVSRIAPYERLTESEQVELKKYVTVGRICRQKNPLALVENLDGEMFSLMKSMTWIGDGDEKLKEALASRRVEISGWVAPSSIPALLRASDVYVHFASWEGFPLALLDAYNCGLPLIVQPILAYGDLRPEQTISGSKNWISKDFDGWRQANRAAWANTFKSNNLEHQKNSLREVWHAN